MYTYYKTFKTDEHMLFDYEIAELLNIYGYHSRFEMSDLAVGLVRALMKDMSKKLSKDEYHYKTRLGLKKVYDAETITAAVNYLNENYVEISSYAITLPIAGKNYKAVFGKENRIKEYRRVYGENDYTPKDKIETNKEKREISNNRKRREQNG